MGDESRDAEWVPTTEIIREGYLFSPEHWADRRVGRDFDRWLAEYTATVLEDARNRLNGHDPAGEQLQRLADDMRGGVYVAGPLGEAMRGNLPTSAQTNPEPS